LSKIFFFRFFTKCIRFRDFSAVEDPVNHKTLSIVVAVVVVVAVAVVVPKLFLAAPRLTVAFQKCLSVDQV